jgi:tetratricopeptide (TPR) repeat protein
MIFSDRLLFLHVPKTGGSSVVRYLLEVLPKPAYYSLPADHGATLPPGVTRFEGIAHETLADARVVLEGRGRRLEGVPVVIACVRNPYELEVSRYSFLRRDLNSYNHGPQQAVALLSDFELFAICSRPHGQRPLETYFVLDGVVPPNLHVVRLENVDQELRECLAAAGVDASETRVPHHNRSEHAHFRQYYTGAAEQAVYEKYKWVFDAGLYPRLRFGDEPQTSRFEEPDAVDRLLGLTLPKPAERRDSFALANAWLAAAEIHRHWLRPSAQHEALERALDYALQVGSDRLTGRTVSELARCMALSGPSTVDAGMERCTALLETPGGTRGFGGTRLVLAELLGAAGRFEEARTICEQVRVESPELALGAASAAGSVELLAADAEAAETLFRRGRPWNPFDFAGDHAEALYRLGRYAEADRLAGFGDATAPATEVRARARWCRMRGKLLAKTGESRRAGELVREAVELIARCEAPNLHADALVDLAEVLAASAREDEAIAALDTATRLYERKGNVVSARSAAALLRDAGSTASVLPGSSPAT